MFYGNNNNNLRQSAEEKYKKEAERKRKEEYRKFLDLQLAEKERNKALEQQKRREEDIKFDNKINLQRQELQQQYQHYCLVGTAPPLLYVYQLCLIQMHLNENRELHFCFGCQLLLLCHNERYQKVANKKHCHLLA
jgi:hypothetical protein